MLIAGSEDEDDESDEDDEEEETPVKKVLTNWIYKVHLL